MADKIQMRRDTAANWKTYNPILADGEWGLESDTKKCKIGNGAVAWNTLDYISLGGDAVNVGYNFTNGQLEANCDDWNLYADATGTVPVDGTGGSATIIKAWNGINPLNGKGDMLITKPASNCQGNGASKDFSIDAGQLGKIAQIDFDYLVPSAYVSGYVNVSIYDITNAKFCPVSVSDISASFGSIAKHSLLFIPNANSKNYRLCIHVASTDTNAYTMEIDNIQLGNWKTFSAPVVSPWVDYAAGSYVFPSSATPVTFSAGKCPIGAVTTNPTKGTTSEDHAQWMREGQDTLIRFDYKQTSAGQSGASVYLFGIPAGQSINLQKNPVNSYVGSGRASTAVGETDVASSPINLYVYDAVTLYAVYVSPAFATLITDKVSSTAFAMSNAVVVYRFSARFTCAQFSINSTFVGVNEPFYLSNSETVANTNGVVSKTKLGIDGSLILANTAATYYDMTLPRALLPNETLQIQVRSKIDGNWINVEDAIVPSLYVSLSARFMNVGNFFHRGFSGIAKVSSGVVRIYIDRALSGGSTAFSDTTEADRTWAQIIAAADGFDAWRVRIGQASTGAEIADIGTRRMWVVFNGIPASPTVYASANVASVTKISTGLYRITFNTPMPHVNYCINGNAGGMNNATGSRFYVGIGNASGTNEVYPPLTTSVVVSCGYSDTGYADAGRICVSIVC